MRKNIFIGIKAVGLLVLAGLAIHMTKVPVTVSSAEVFIPSESPEQEEKDPEIQLEQMEAKPMLVTGKIFQKDSLLYEVMTSNQNKRTGTVMLIGMTDPKQEVIIPEMVIGSDDCTYTVTQIAEKCFYGNTKVTSIYIPATIRNIRACAFSGCKSLKKIAVDKFSLYYKTKNNALYSEDGSKLIALLNAGISYTPPSTVTRIESGAFVYCKDLETITIPKTVKSMGMIFDNACLDLKTIIFKSSVPPAIEKCIKIKDGRITQLLCNIDYYHSKLRILVPKGSEVYYSESLKEIFKSKKALPIVPYRK